MKKSTLLVSYVGRLIETLFGLAVFAFGIYFTIQGDTGLSPWDTLASGVTCQIPGLTYGMANIVISIVILVIDFLMKEPIGFGTILNAVMIGVFADIYSGLGILPHQDNLILGVLFLIIGLFFMALGQYFYMSGRMGCGPRDAFLVGLGKKLAQWPIGVVQTVILVVVLAAGFLLGAKVGIGTLIATLGVGTAMQIVFRLLKFEPRKLIHEDVVQTVRRILKK